MIRNTYDITIKLISDRITKHCTIYVFVTRSDNVVYNLKMIT